MINNNPFNTFYAPTISTNSNTAQEIKKYTEAVARRQKMGLEGDGAGDTCFAARLKQAEELKASGESCGATDSVAIILKRMGEPTAGEPVTMEVIHKGVRVQVTKDAMFGNTITIGGSSNPDWIQVSTSVGNVKIDLNDLDSLMKCLDMFSPEDINAILRKITEVRQSRDALQEIDNAKNTPVEQAEKKEDEEEEA